MTFRISQFAAACGLSLLALPGLVSAQAPRYQSPLSAPAQPQPSALPVPPAITPNGTVVEDVIVRVNDQIISRSDVERGQQQLAEEIQRNNVPPAEAAEEQRNLLRDMIDKQLMLSRAKELGMNADNEVIHQLDEIRKQNKLGSMEELERAARQQGVSFEDFKADIRDKILEQQVVREEVGRRLQMSQSQVQAYYDAHKQEFEQPEQVRLSEILVPTAAEANDAEVAQAQAKAADIAAKIKGGAKFDELAKTFSGGPTAQEGGDLGLFKRGSGLAKVIEDQTFVLKAGETTAPIRTRQGFVILKVTEHQAAGVPALKDVEPQIQEALYTSQLQPAMRAYLTHLREDAYVDVKAGFVDTGASAKQTKPVFTATAPPPVKKKKAEDKQRFDRGGRFSTNTKATGATAPVAAAASPAVPALPAAGATTTAAGSTTTAAAAGTAAATTAGATTGAAVGASNAAAAPAAAKTVTTTSSKSATPSKPKTIQKEKVRFGQAPRNSLPAAPTDTVMDKGLGRPDSEGPGGQAAPGAAMAPTESVTTFSASSDPDPLTPKTVVTGKTRYSAKAKTEAETKAKAKSVKAQEKAAATPAPASVDEKAAQATQAAPLGLNGDTVKKKKPTKVKGAPKERMQQQPKAPAPPPQEPTPYRTNTPKPDAPAAPATDAAPAGGAPAPAPAPK